MASEDTDRERLKYNAYDTWVASLRPAKNERDPAQPVASWTEREMLPDGRTGIVGTIIINNRECPYRCVMCGLWQDTTDITSAEGVVAGQISHALAEMGPLDAIKLYNAGSFFDEAAIPVVDQRAIARACRDVGWVIVESRPDLCDKRVSAFAGQLAGRLEIAIGLETVDRTVLAFLNKRMTLADYEKAAGFLSSHGIAHRVFIMVKPPLCNESRGLELGLASIETAVRNGASAVSLIPTYVTPGAMEELHRAGFVKRPTPWSLYRLAAAGLNRGDVRVFVDTWTLRQSDHCDACIGAFADAFKMLNTCQTLPRVSCDCERAHEERLRTETVGGEEAYREWLRRKLEPYRGGLETRA